MANHALPTTSSLYTDVLTNIKDRIDDSLKMLDSVNTTPTSVPTNAVRWNSTTKLWEKYNGSAWGSLAASYAIQVLKSSNLVGGNSTTLLGSIPYQSNTDTTTLLAPNTTTTRKFLRQTGSGTDGSAPVWDTILAADVPTLNQNTTGNAATATKLYTARTIGGVSFNGTADINLPGVNTAGNQNTTGNAATATTANALNSSNSYTGVGFTANTGAFRAQNWGGVPTNGVTYYGNANSYIFKSGASWSFNNEQSGYGNLLNTDGNIVTANGGTWSINATSSSALVGDETNWANYRTKSVANMLGWKNYGNGHCIFDASAGTAPNGVAINNTHPISYWVPTFPTLMGWNGSTTFGVRVDSARAAEAFTTAVGSAPSYACRAWVNFNGTGTVAIRASGNVSSITDRGVGIYTVNLTTALQDINGSAHTGTALNSNTNIANGVSTGPIRIVSTTAVNIGTGNTAGPSDQTDIYCSIFR